MDPPNQKFLDPPLTKQAVAQTAVKTGKEAVKTGIGAATKQVVAQTTVKTGREVVKTSVNAMTKQAVVQTASNSGHEMIKTGIHVATKEVDPKCIKYWSRSNETWSTCGD